MCAYWASDLYLKRILLWMGSAKRTCPWKLIQFKGCEEPILLRLLADGKALEDVDNAEASYEVKNPLADACPHAGLRIRGECEKESV